VLFNIKKQLLFAVAASTLVHVYLLFGSLIPIQSSYATVNGVLTVRVSPSSELAGTSGSVNAQHGGPQWRDSRQVERVFDAAAKPDVSHSVKRLKPLENQIGVPSVSTLDLFEPFVLAPTFGLQFFKAEDLDKRPQLRNDIPTDFLDISVAAQAQFDLYINEFGDVIEIKFVDEHKLNPLLKKAVLEVRGKLKYEPGQRLGLPVNSIVRIEISTIPIDAALLK
jgi:hypothetical protein